MRYQGKSRPYTKEKPQLSPIRYFEPTPDEWLRRYKECLAAGLLLAAAYCLRRSSGIFE